jgi:ABC-type branched-subunit amino acid transport system substrate-binding protein
MSGGTRDALLIGCAEYEDPRFQQLSIARQDLETLAPVLENPEIGNFTVNTLLGNQSDEVAAHIEKFFANRRSDDLLLLYFSCHGVLDPRERLYFVAANTRKDLLNATGISARWVKEQMDHSRSQRIVLLLDCCYSGAFGGGLTRRGAGAEDIVEQLGGHGRVVITASDKKQYAYESRFTNAVVRGLGSGAADLDGDGQISVNELYRYVYNQVCQDTPNQTPTMSADRMRGELYLASNPYTEQALPDELAQVLTSEIAWKRLWAIDGLRRLLAGDHPGGQKRTARRALDDLLHHDTDHDVRAAATETLSIVRQPPNVTDSRRSGHRLAKVSVATVVALASLAVVLWGTFFPVMEAGSIPCSPLTKNADGVLSLGTILPQTGDYIYTGPALEAGVRLAIKDINAAGVIPGSVVTLDDANQRDEGNSSDDTAVKSTDALLAGGVDVIIGPSTSAVAGNVLDKVVCAGVLMFAPSNTSPEFTMWRDHGLYFRVMPPSNVEASVLGKLVVDDGNSTVVVMSRDDAYAHPLRTNIVNAIQEFGGQVLDSFHYDQNALDRKEDVQRVVQRVKAKNPDAIVLIGFTESARILAAMIEEGLGPKSKRVYSDSGNLSNNLAGQVNRQDLSVLAGMRGTLPHDGGDAFVKRLREVNGGLHDVAYAAQSYDAMVITVLAAAVAHTDAPALVAKEINGVTKTGEKCTSFETCLTLVKDGKDIDYDGPSGPLEFTDPGEPSFATYVINEIQADGTVKPLSSERVGS